VGDAFVGINCARPRTCLLFILKPSGKVVRFTWLVRCTVSDVRRSRRVRNRTRDGEMGLRDPMVVPRKVEVVGMLVKKYQAFHMIGSEISGSCTMGDEAYDRYISRSGISWRYRKEEMILPSK
jgi:hypothetical protein